MDIALMNVRILFQKNAVQTDKVGNHTNAWEDYYSCYATVSGEGGTEKTAAGLVVDDSDICFSVRYCRLVSKIDSTGYRIIFGGSIYNILSIDHMNYKRKSVKFKCQRVRR